MSNDSRETGWQRFLDRLKRLWGNSRRGGLTPVSTAMQSSQVRARLRLQCAPSHNSQ
jgi:hypothetical protein